MIIYIARTIIPGRIGCKHPVGSKNSIRVAFNCFFPNSDVINKSNIIININMIIRLIILIHTAAF